MPQVSERQWTSWRIPDNSHRLFYLLWLEMLGEHTLDSWQIRTCNIRVLLEELTVVAASAEVHQKHIAYLPPLREEAVQTAKLDPIVARHFPFIVPQLESMAVTPQEFKNTGRVLSSHLRNYCARLTGDLRALLADPDRANQAKLLARLTVLLGTELAAEGYSLPHLVRVSASLRDPTVEDFPTRFDALLAQCSGVEKHYDCLFHVTCPASLVGEEFPLTSVRLKRLDPAVQGEPQSLTKFRQQVGNDFVADIHVNARDPDDARSAAERILARAFASLTLFQPQTSVALRADVALVSSEASARLVVSDRSRLTHIKNLSALGTLLGRLKVVHERLEPADRERLDASIEYHRLAVTAETDAMRIVNLWIALECVVSASPGPIIDRACEWIPPCLALRHGAKYLRGVGNYIRAYWRRDFEPFRDLFPNSSVVSIKEDDLIAVLLEADGGPRIRPLFDRIGDPLIRHRMWRVATMLQTPSELAEGADQHRKNVDWQLRRIYRARNSVAHRASMPTTARHLVQHLHAYYVLFVRSVVEDIATNDGWTFPQAFQYRRLLFAHVQDALRKLPMEEKRLTPAGRERLTQLVLRPQLG